MCNEDIRFFHWDSNSVWLLQKEYESNKEDTDFDDWHYYKIYKWFNKKNFTANQKNEEQTQAKKNQKIWIKFIPNK